MRYTILSSLLLVLVSMSHPVSASAQCSRPYRVEQKFPVKGPMETSWLLCWQPVAGSGLVITAAYFRKSPSAPYVKLFYDARVAEIFVPYHSGQPRYLDVGYGYGMLDLTSADCPPPDGTILGQTVCKEVRSRGLAWKDDVFVRRGEELVLWGVIDAANYNYVIEWTFRDDGVVLGRLGATGPNMLSNPFEAHMHGVIWRLDIDLDGHSGDSAYLVRHEEAGAQATDTPELISTESGQKWNPLEFTTLSIRDKKLKNAQGHPSGYRLMPWRWGTPRHIEDFTQSDYWVTRYHYQELSGSSLPWYINKPENVAGTDIVAWYYGAVHHLPRDEDGRTINGLWSGKALLMWTGFMLMPSNLFDETPLCSPPACS